MMYVGEKNTLTVQYTSDSLRKLGLKKGDSVMVQSAFSSLGSVEGGPEGFIKAIENIIGPEGTIIMPTFNWDILHQGDEIIFDIKNTSSKMGFLTEYFRKRPGTKRSQNLFNPLGYSGRLAEELDKHPHTESWGSDSPFQLLYEENAAILMVGVDYNIVTMFHVAEAMVGVPYRFVYEFPNAFLIDESRNKLPVKQTTLRRHDGHPTDFNVADEVLKKKGLVNKVILGNSITRLVRAKSLVDCIIEELKKDSEFLIKKTLSRKWVPTRKPGVFYTKDFINELWLKNRVLLSDDYDWSLKKKIGEYIPLKVNSYPTGMSVWDWTIPEKWTNRGGKILSSDGRVLFDLSLHPLHIAAGSVPFRGTISKEGLLKHIRTDPTRPSAIPYCTLYYGNDWAICLPHNSLSKLEGGHFNIELYCERTSGELKIGECTIEGITKDSIIIPLHLDHPGQCNDNLSGVAVAIDLILKLLKIKKKFNHTLRFVFLPETIGIFTYLSQNPDLIPFLKWGIVFDSVGTSGDLMFMKSLDGNTRLDICTQSAFKKLVPKYSEFSFLEIEGYGNDERGLQALGVGIPSISISRFPFKECHSSLDTPDIISPQNLRPVRDVVFEIIRTLDMDFIPVRKYEGIPQLSKMANLEEIFYNNPKSKKAIHKSFFLLDGKRSISQIAFETDMTFDFTYNFFLELKKYNKIEINRN